MKSLLLAILTLGIMFGEDTPKPKFTDPVISQYTKSIEDIDMDAVKKKREVRNKTVTTLDASIKKAMASGELDKVIWLKGEKDRIAKEWVPSDGELIGEKPQGDYSNSSFSAIITKYKWHLNAEWNFYDDKTFTVSTLTNTGTYEVNKNKLILYWNSGSQEVYNYDPIKKTIIHPNGGAFTKLPKNK